MMVPSAPRLQDIQPDTIKRKKNTRIPSSHETVVCPEPIKQASLLAVSMDPVHRRVHSSAPVLQQAPSLFYPTTLQPIAQTRSFHSLNEATCMDPILALHSRSASAMPSDGIMTFGGTPGKGIKVTYQEKWEPCFGLDKSLFSFFGWRKKGSSHWKTGYIELDIERNRLILSKHPISFDSILNTNKPITSRSIKLYPLKNAVLSEQAKNVVEYHHVLQITLQSGVMLLIAFHNGDTHLEWCFRFKKALK